MFNNVKKNYTSNNIPKKILKNLIINTPVINKQIISKVDKQTIN